MRASFTKASRVAAVLFAIGSLVSCGQSDVRTYKTNLNAETLLREAKDIKGYSDRVSYFSRELLGTEYGRGPLGEGPGGSFDRDPLYRFDRFDCTTYLETVIALAKSDTRESFEKNILAVRFSDSNPTYVSRNHFPELDWVPNGLKKGFFTTVQLPEDMRSTHLSEINKGNWLRKKRLRAIDTNESKPARLERLKRLRSEGDQFESQNAVVNYVSFEALFDGVSRIEELFEGLPDILFFNLVRIPRDIIKPIGTGLSIWHQGILVRSPNGGQFTIRHADELERIVREVPAADFFVQSYSKERLDSEFLDSGIELFAFE